MTQRMKELVWVLIAALIIVAMCALWDATHAAKVGGEWVPLGPYNGGINTTSNRGQLSSAQFVASSNFVWNAHLSGGAQTGSGLLEVREGFYRFAAPESGRGVEWIDIYKSPSGSSYLFYSDGVKLWYRTDLTEPAVELDFGRANAGTVDTYSGSPYVYGNTLPSQALRTVFGPGDSLTMTIDGAEYTVKTIVGDTLVLLEDDFGSTLSATSYNMDLASLSVNSAFQVNNNFWVYTNVGKFYFERPGLFVIVDSLTGTRYAYTSALRTCIGSVPTIKFTASGVTDNFSGQFARITTNPFSQGTPGSPAPYGQSVYLSLPVYSSGGGFLYTLGAAFGPKVSTAQYITVEDLAIDTSTKVTKVLDSVQVLVADSSGFGCGGSYNLYLQLFCDSCDWQDDTTRFISGDHFVAPLVATSTVGVSESSPTNGVSTIYNTVIATKVTTPNQSAIKAYRLRAWGNSNGTGVTTTFLKGAIYLASDSSLVDTTLTLARTFMTSTYTEVELSFAEGVDLAASTGYFVAIWSDSSLWNAYYKNGSGTNSLSKGDAYTGTFLDPLVGALASSRQYVIWLDVDYYDADAAMMTNAMNCLPVVGGYVTSDSTIYAAVAAVVPGARGDWTKVWNRMADRDTCRVAFFRMKKVRDNAAEGIAWAVLFNSTVFEARSDHRDWLWWSEPDMPDSFLVTHFMIVDHGNPLIVGAPQGGNLIVYTATNRWAIMYAGGGIYAKQYLDGQRGCIARGSFLNIDGVHYGLAADGYWETAGEAPALISGAVASYFTDSLDFGRLDDVAAGYDAENDNIWITQKNRFTLVYNRGTGSWWPQSWQAGAYYYNADISVSDSVRFIAGGADSSGLFVRGGATDDGVSIDASMQTGWLDYGVSQLIKNVKGLRLGYEADRPTSWLCETFGQNYTTGATFEVGSFAGSMISGWSEAQMRFFQGTYRGKRLAHKLTFYNASGLKLPYFQVLVKMGVEE